MLLPDDFSRQKDERGEDEEKRFEISGKEKYGECEKRRRRRGEVKSRREEKRESEKTMLSPLSLFPSLGWISAKFMKETINFIL